MVLNRSPETLARTPARTPERAIVVSHDSHKLAAMFDRLHGDHVATFEASRPLLKEAAALAEAAISTLSAGGKLLLCGNGGSAADSQHIATEMTVRFEKTRRGLPAIALTTDTSALTAAGNDFGFEHVFSRQVEALGRKGDLLIGITTSGNSPNVISALRVARKLGLVTACLAGHGGGQVARENLADHVLTVPGASTARAQEVHIFLGHLVCAAVDAAFAG
jgi:D-sedoheptulose 7-phosphate isomerase